MIYFWGVLIGIGVAIVLSGVVILVFEIAARFGLVSIVRVKDL